MEHQSQYGGLFSDICSLLINDKKYSRIIGKNISFGDRFIHEYGTFDQHNHRLNFSVQGLFNKYKEF